MEQYATGAIARYYPLHFQQDLIQGDVLSIQYTPNNYLIVDQTWVGGG